MFKQLTSYIFIQLKYSLQTILLLFFNSQSESHEHGDTYSACSNPGCGKSVQETDLEKHLKDCPMRPMTYSYSGDKIIQEQKKVGACFNSNFNHVKPYVNTTQYVKKLLALKY